MPARRGPSGSVCRSYEDHIDIDDEVTHKAYTEGIHRFHRLVKREKHCPVFHRLRRLGGRGTNIAPGKHQDAIAPAAPHGLQPERKER